MSKLDMTNYSSSSDEEILLTQIPKYADIKNFNGCYLLYSLNEKYLGKTYIGYTVNPYRRVRQHNRLIKGGASKTLRAGPWDMILIIYGFPNNVSALRFEWAWQNPKKSRRLTQIPPKKRKETEFIYKYRIMLYMLNIGPWCRLPLSFCWLKPDYKIQIINANVDLKVPIHMDVTEIGIKNNEWLLKPKQISDTCFICQKTLSTLKRLDCLNTTCFANFHILCLSYKLTKDENSQQILPIGGNCPKCKNYMLWGKIMYRFLLRYD